jgi:hypothetical protein
MPLVLNGTTGVQDNSGAFVAGTAVASTSGTSIDFTSIPSWVKRVTVMFQGVSTNGTSQVMVQLGTSSGVTSSGYLGTASYFGSNASNFSSGFLLGDTSSAQAVYVRHGTMVINLLGSNNWCETGIIGVSHSAFNLFSAGSVSLAATLDRVRITTVNGTDTFDAGTINILYE